MTQVSQLASSPVRTVEFASLDGNASMEDQIEKMTPEMGVVYVTAITRDGCSGCIEQKPLFNELAAKMDAKQGRQVSFSRIHIQYSEGNVAQSSAAKKVLR